MPRRQPTRRPQVAGRPRAKRGDPGAPKPERIEDIPVETDPIEAVPVEADPEQQDTDDVADTVPSPRRPRRLVAVALVVGVLATVAAGLLGWQYFDARAVTANHALSDPVGTEQVRHEVSNAVQTVFSFHPDNAAAHRQAVNAVLSEQARGKFAELYDPVIEQDLVLATTVRMAAVLHLTEDRATLLLAVDQTVTDGAKKDEDERSGGGLLKVNATLTGTTWRITDFTPYT